MQERRSGTHGLFRVNDGGQRFVVDSEEFERVLGEVAVFGDDAHDRLADIAHLATRERQDRCGVIMGHARGRDQRLDRAGQILGGENRDDARGRARRGSVDRANARMRLVAPAEGDVQRAHHLPVIGEGAVAGQQARVLGPFDARADELRPGVDVRRVIHRRRRLCAGSPTALASWPQTTVAPRASMRRISASDLVSTSAFQVLRGTTPVSRVARTLTASEAKRNVPDFSSATSAAVVPGV